MAIAGSEEKEIVKQKILEVFSDSFVYDKEIRIPLNGRQIKVTLTCAKVNVEHGEDNAVPSTAASAAKSQSFALTEEEKKETADLLASLNL